MRRRPSSCSVWHRPISVRIDGWWYRLSMTHKQKSISKPMLKDTKSTVPGVGILACSWSLPDKGRTNSMHCNAVERQSIQPFHTAQAYDRIVIIIPSSLLKVRDCGNAHQFSPTLHVSCYCCAPRQSCWSNLRHHHPSVSLAFLCLLCHVNTRDFT